MDFLLVLVGAAVLGVASLLVLYFVVRVAVHHGVRDADRSRAWDERHGGGPDGADDAALRRALARSRRDFPE